MKPEPIPRTITDRLLGHGVGPRWRQWATRCDRAAGWLTDAVSRTDYPGTDDAWQRLVAREALLRQMAGEAVAEDAPEAGTHPDRVPVGMWRSLASLEQTKAVDEAGAWVSDMHSDSPPWQGLLLIGGTGSGKTAVSCAIAHDLDQPHSWWHVTDVVAAGKGDTSGYRARQLARRQVLILDDLGAEDPGPNDWHVRLLRELLEARHRHRLTTVLTTNLTLVQVGTTYGPRVRSRLMEMCRVVPVLGTDRRAM